MPESARTLPELREIRAVTCMVPDLERVEACYTRWLRYQVVARGDVPEQVAAGWHAAALAERSFLTLAPESGERCFLRFVEAPEAAGWRALMTHGWNATEIVVQDVDALAESLADSPFHIIGAPRSLTRFPMIRAMQVIGPSGECLYLTQVGEGSGLELAAARSFVGRVFIVVAGGADLEALFRVYARFGNATDAPVATPVHVLSLAHGLPPETEHRHGLVKLRHGTLIELDQYPAGAGTRRRVAGAMRAGMAMVTLAVDVLPPEVVGEARVAGVLLPDEDAPAITLTGGAGELIELMEAPSA